MSERAQELGGEWGIESLDKGTKVWAKLPIVEYKRDKDGE